MHETFSTLLCCLYLLWYVHSWRFLRWTVCTSEQQSSTHSHGAHTDDIALMLHKHDCPLGTAQEEVTSSESVKRSATCSQVRRNDGNRHNMGCHNRNFGASDLDNK